MSRFAWLVGRARNVRHFRRAGADLRNDFPVASPNEPLLHRRGLIRCHHAEPVCRLLRLHAELRIFRRYLGMHQKRALVPTEKMQTRKSPDARERDITLAEFENS